jgi:mercuric ion binding protein
MKKNLLLAVMCLFAITASAKKEYATVTFAVPIECENCVNKVESNIAFEKGVKDIKCDIAGETVTVTYDANKTNVVELKAGFAKINYKDVQVKSEVKACCAAKVAAGEEPCCTVAQADTKKACCKGKSSCSDR